MIFRKTPRPKGPDQKKPALIAFIVLMGLALAVLAQAVLGTSRAKGELAPAISESRSSLGGLPAAPAGLQAAIENLAGREQGKNGVLVRSVEDDWVAGYKGATPFSQGSLRRVWLGAALLDAVDVGDLSLEQRVPLLSARKGGRQPRMQVGELLSRAVRSNDRDAQDHVLDGLMGPAGMARWLETKGIDEVGFGPSNRDMMRLPARARATFHSNPPDGATPDGMAFGLSHLFAGKLLGESSTQLLLSFFASRSASPGHGAETGWSVLRLTGETFGSNRQVIAASGAALVRSREGRRFIVVAFADGTANAPERRDRLLDSAVFALETNEIR